jgi:hypothetical protein
VFASLKIEDVLDTDRSGSVILEEVIRRGGNLARFNCLGLAELIVTGGNEKKKLLVVGTSGGNENRLLTVKRFNRRLEQLCRSLLWLKIIRHR